MTYFSDKNRPVLQGARALMTSIHSRRPDDFTGIGVVFYDDLKHLPHLQLIGTAMAPDVAHYGDGDLASALAAISTEGCALHDGFHFVNARSMQLTHLSQFISPPIPADVGNRFLGTGARLMAAVLASILPGILCVGLVSQRGEVHVFHDGADVYGND